MKLKRHTLLALTVLLLFLIPDGSYAQFRNPGIFKKPSASAKKTAEKKTTAKKKTTKAKAVEVSAEDFDDET